MAISIVSSDVIFIEEVITQLNNIPTKDGYVARPVLSIYHYYDFELKLQIIIHDIYNALPFPIHVRLISPDNIQKIYTLEEDASMLETGIIYDYDFGFQTQVLGWFKIEIGIFPPENSPDKEIVFDKTTVFLKKE